MKRHARRCRAAGSLRPDAEMRFDGRKIDAQRIGAERGGTSRYHTSHDPAAIEGLLVDVFLDAHVVPPDRSSSISTPPMIRCTGSEGRFFHGYYDNYCYLPLYVFCGRHLLAAKLRPANIDGAAGAVEEMARLVAKSAAAGPGAHRVACR